jgi:hypothetical protein
MIDRHRSAPRSLANAKLDARSTRNRIIELRASASRNNNNDARDGH